jgi:hypothetical protein
MVFTWINSIRCNSNGFIDALGGFFGFIAAFILAEIPILGTVMGIRGAMNSWGWEFVPSLLLFIGVLLLDW